MKRLLLLLSLIPVFGICLGQAIHISASDTNVCFGTQVAFMVTDTATSAWHFQWQVNSINSGGDSATYITDTLRHEDTVRCLRTNAVHDTVFATSNAIIMAVDTVFPNAGTITGPDKVCVGATITLADTVIGGVWGRTNTHANVANGLVTGISANFFECPYDAVDTILYVVSGTACTDTAFHAITIKPKPWIRAELITPWICPFPPFKNLFYQPYCYSYTYFVQSDSSKIGVSGYIYCVSTNVCGTNTVKIPQKVTYHSMLTDTPVINITSSEICMGSKTMISATPGGYKQNWRLTNDNASLISDSLGVYVQGNKAGLVTLILQYFNVCGNSTAKPDSAIVRINPLPGSSPYLLDVCARQYEMLIDSIPGGTWTSGNTSIAVIGSFTGIIQGVSEGRATITYTLPGNCAGFRKIAVSDCGSRIELFPVPARNELLVHLLADSLYSTCILINATGQMLRQQPIKGEYTIIDIHMLQHGIYFLRLTGDKGQTTLKFQKE